MSRRRRYLRHAACVRKMKNIYKILVGNSEMRRLLGRSSWLRLGYNGGIL
jgi:hypothetical protein